MHEDILNDRNNSHLLIVPGNSTDVVIGVPHHSPLGVPQLPCREHPDADENAGFAGLRTARLLDCTCIIACNYFIDPNKHANTDYCQKNLFNQAKNIG